MDVKLQIYLENIKTCNILEYKSIRNCIFQNQNSKIVATFARQELCTALILKCEFTVNMNSVSIQSD